MPASQALLAISEESSEEAEDIKDKDSKFISTGHGIRKNYGEHLDQLNPFSDEDRNESYDPSDDVKSGPFRQTGAINKAASETALRKRTFFQGHNILIDHTQKDPYSIQSASKLSNDEQILRLLQFLNANKNAYSSPNQGRIVIVDDQYVGQQLIMLEFQDLGITNEVLLLSSGQEACDFFEQTLSEIQTDEQSK